MCAGSTCSSRLCGADGLELKLRWTGAKNSSRPERAVYRSMRKMCQTRYRDETKPDVCHKERHDSADGWTMSSSDEGEEEEPPSTTTLLHMWRLLFPKLTLPLRLFLALSYS